MSGMMRRPPTRIDLSTHQATVYIILRSTNKCDQKPPTPRYLNRSIPQDGELEPPLNPRYHWSDPTPNPDRSNRQVCIGVENPDPYGETTWTIHGAAFRSSSGLQAGLTALNAALTQHVDSEATIFRDAENEVTVERTRKDGNSGPTGRLVRIAVHDHDDDNRQWAWWEILELQIH